ncbi:MULTISPECIES: flagellar motor switch protein [Bacillus cereus group]|uniref:CheY-P phosphatase CheC n=2 Tax=Bacillus mobilis TaxID=2026190 RepID=A0A1Y6AB15_9BACI|nr:MULTISPECIES: flagellar motor switch protein [Bacillus cereus group]MDX5838269.1 flagellar motor switch protein [Bacillus cereus group sp. BfR-BA-01700]NEK98870.1 flagellar motor switch phosphatase FliY [Bacillus mobilis]OJE42739.1 flagellar motor switch protein [Bacillus mobilis]SME29221.1 CheY-P phosphatase CheC [Bacillus mobilis]HDR7240226.1 flagellar motor switch phosphatase FliY [Bacillus mobilis]
MPEQHTKGDTSTIVLDKEKELLTPQECDILGEIANISFGSASTVLSTILNRQVSITAPHVELVDLYDTSDVEVPHVVLNIHFTKGLDMENLLVLQQDVALSIADLMMMGTGEVEEGKELGELELSAVQEAMNQMMGFAATSMSEFFQDTVDMSPPTIKVVKLSEEMEKISGITGNNTIVKVSFDLKIDNLVNSKLVQIVPVEHTKQMINKLLQLSGEEQDEPAEVVEAEIVEEHVEKEQLTQEEKDVLGEIANISIGSASTVLSTLLNQPVTISTPNVEAINVRHYDGVPVPFVILNVDFVEGLKNENVFVFTKDVALTMVDLMMMGTGEIDPEKELSELELSGIKEIMNQMMGHAATAMSEMFKEKMDMTPPDVKFVTLKEEMEYLGEAMEVDELVQITFNLEIGDLLQSKMYQILPISEAKEMVRRLLYPMVEAEEEIVEEEIEEEVVEPVVQPIEFKEVKQIEPVYMDTSILQNVEMNVKFVFGSTVKTIQDILSLQENEAVVLDEDIDEPIRIYVNDVLVAYGELVNVDGFFGVKVTKSL